MKEPSVIRVFFLLAFGVFLAGLFGCQVDKQNVVETSLPETAQTPEPGAQDRNAMIATTARERLNSLREKAKAKPQRRKDAGHLSADKAVHDYGEVEPRAKLQAKFVLTNDGKEDLKIKDVKSSCSCLASKLKTKTLSPGQSIPLTLTFTTPTAAGKVVKTARITTEPPGLPETLVLQVNARVKRYIEVTPEHLELKLRGNAESAPTLTVKSTDKKPFRITSARSSNKKLELVYDKAISSKEHTVRVKLDPHSQSNTSHGGIITFQLNHPSMKTLSVPYRIVLPYAAHPTVRRFTSAQPGHPAQAEIDIVSNYDEAFELDEIKSEKGYVKVLKEEKVAKGYKLQLEMCVPEDSKQRMPNDHLNIKIKDDPGSSLRILCYTLNR